jgi:hypothetical protein
MNIISTYLVDVEKVFVFFEVFHAIVRDFLSYVHPMVSCVYYYDILKIELLIKYGIVGSQKQFYCNSSQANILSRT